MRELMSFDTPDTAEEKPGAGVAGP